MILTHCGRDKMDAISQTTFSSIFSWMKMVEFRFKIHWSLFLRVQLTIFQIMAWRRPGDKPSSEPMMVSLLTHICVTRPQWFNFLMGVRQPWGISLLCASREFAKSLCQENTAKLRHIYFKMNVLMYTLWRLSEFIYFGITGNLPINIYEVSQNLFAVEESYLCMSNDCISLDIKRTSCCQWYLAC